MPLIFFFFLDWLHIDQHAGWMADFGEYVPFDSVLATGQPAEVHNLFPELWAGVNREAVTDPNTSSLLPVSLALPCC